MSSEPDFKINTTRQDGFEPDVFNALPSQQRVLELAIGGTRFRARSLEALVEESGLSADLVRDYCERSAHIARSPNGEARDKLYFGYRTRLGEKYMQNETGQFTAALPDHQTPPFRHDVFLSYAHEDAHLASDVARALQRQEITCFVAEKNLRAGEDWSEAVRSALADSWVVLPLLTSRSLGKPWIFIESGAAWALQKRIVPLLNQIGTEQLMAPLSAREARTVESANSLRDLAKELAALKLERDAG